jgi:hypothetical protein
MVEGSGCDFTGWFAIDHIVYSGTRIDELELRFERLCDGNSIPRHGQIHFVRP